MISESSASERFTRLQQDLEILLWRYATAQSERQRQVIGLRIMELKLKQSLMGAFYGAVLDLEKTGAALRNAVIHAKSLSPANAVRRALLMRESMEKWEEAKAQNDFSVVSDSLQGLVNSVRKEAQVKAKEMGISSPYEALVKSKTPGFSAARFEALIADLATFSRQALDRIPKSAAPAGRIWNMRQPGQKQVQNSLLKMLGYDFNRGNIKQSPHPLCFGMHDDVRIGVCYNEDDFSELILTLTHEGGHGLYRQGLPADQKDNLSGQIAGVGMDEAMSLIMENHVGRSKEFAAYMANYIRATMVTHDDLALSGQALYERLTRIADEPIRIKADEVRYPLDVILRYKIEKALIDDDMEVREIPAYWAQEYERLTGMKVKDDNEGALQDIHWFGGEFGWFPNYLIGQMAAAQLFEAACMDNPDISKQLGKGNTRPLTDWLRDNIYRYGARYTSFELIEKATGKVLGADAYKKHIDERYLKPLRAPGYSLAPQPDLP